MVFPIRDPMTVWREEEFFPDRLQDFVDFLFPVGRCGFVVCRGLPRVRVLDDKGMFGCRLKGVEWCGSIGISYLSKRRTRKMSFV